MSSTKNPLQKEDDPLALDELIPATQQSTDHGNELNAAQQPVQHEPFSTWTNCIVIFFFYFSINFASGFGAIGGLVYSTFYGMSLIWVSNVNIMTFCVTTPLTIFASAWSDNLSGKWAYFGRRKPFIMLSFPIIVMAGLMFSYPQVDESNPKVLQYWYLVAMMLLFIAPAFFYIPFKSWMIESCVDADDYRKMNAVQYVSALLGGILSQIMITTAPKAGQSPLMGTRYALGVFLVTSLPSFFLAIWLVPSRQLSEVPKQPPIISSFRSCIRTKEFQTVFKNETLLAIASGGAQEFILIVLYISFQFRTTVEVQKYFQPVMMIVLVCTLLVVGTLMWALKRMEKVVIYRFCMLLLIVIGLVWAAMLLPGIISFIDPGVYTDTYTAGQMKMYAMLYMTFFALCNIIMVACMFIQGLLVRDLIIFDTFTNKVNRESVYQTAISIPANLIKAVILNLTTGILYSTGFHTKSGVSSDVVSDIYTWNVGTLWQCFGDQLFFAVAIGYGAYYIMSDYSLTSPIAAKMEEINQKREDDLANKSKMGLLSSDMNRNDPEEEEAAVTVTTNTSPSCPISERSSCSSKPMNISSPINDGEESNLMNHFSQLECKAMSESGTTNGRNTALQDITNSNMFGGAFLGSLSLISLAIATIHTLSGAGSDFTTILLTLFMAILIYVGYEGYRRVAINTLAALPVDEVKDMAVRQHQRNSKYTMNLQELLEKNLIDENNREYNESVDNSVLSRLSFTNTSTKMSITKQAPQEDTNHPLSGYKRIYSVLIVLTGVGIGVSFLKK